MAKRIIKVHDFIGSEGRSRVNVSKLGLRGIPASDTVVLDFAGVDFLSRSFTDEIISQLEGRSYALENTNEIIKNMFKAVVDGRMKSRRHDASNADIKRFDTLVELSRYLNMVM